jgi:circadian clock protein KaiC
MTETSNGRQRPERKQSKAPTGIAGLDEILGGGLPRGRATLVLGGAGCDKTRLALEFLVRGATQFVEPGVFLTVEDTFAALSLRSLRVELDELAQQQKQQVDDGDLSREEAVGELSNNVRFCGIDLDELTEQKKLHVDHVDLSNFGGPGMYDVHSLFRCLGCRIDYLGAKRVVLDNLEKLLGDVCSDAIFPSVLRDLFRWLKAKGITALITGEGGVGTLPRLGLAEALSDCVIELDHGGTEQLSTRWLRIVKCRGTTHVNNKHPFLIDESGVSVLPITPVVCRTEASDERISTGLRQLDAMLGGGGFYRGSSVLISGTVGIGKTSLAGHFADATCQRGERCLCFTFEESESQLVRNMRSIGLDLAPWQTKGLLRVHAFRSTLCSLETHLATLHKLVSNFQPHVVIVDPITAFVKAEMQCDAGAMLMHLIDWLKARQTTAIFTNLTHGLFHEPGQVTIGSFIDTWLVLGDLELGGERIRALQIKKARGIAHSNHMCELLLTDQGVKLLDGDVKPERVLTGSLRLALEVREQAAALNRQLEVERRQCYLEWRCQALEAQLARPPAQLGAEKQEPKLLITQEKATAEPLPKNREKKPRNREVGLSPETSKDRSRKSASARRPQ